MDRFDAMQAFARVVEAGSFTKAAETVLEAAKTVDEDAKTVKKVVKKAVETE